MTQSFYVLSGSLAANVQEQVSAVDFEIFAQDRVPWRQAMVGVPQCHDVDGGWVQDAGRHDVWH